MEKHQLSAQTYVESVESTLAQALWNRDLNTDVEPFANPEHLLEQLAVLPTREYSIASIPSQQVLRLTVRQQFDQNGQLGLGSGWLTEHLSVGESVALRIRTNPSFHLIDDNRPIVCIGNGTGIAGLMSLLHARIRHDYTENWLIFGERQQACDFLRKYDSRMAKHRYVETIGSGVLTRSGTKMLCSRYLERSGTDFKTMD